jgi:aspartyl-tRNA(Asn)/glutamyl-tRNA(Gln) amidotransferase subunit C
MITKKQVRHIAKLARLGLAQKEIEKMQKDLSLILDYFSLLKEIDTEKIEPTCWAIEREVLAEKIMRKDQPQKYPPEKVIELIEMAPKKEKRYIRVKSVL